MKAISVIALSVMTVFGATTVSHAENDKYVSLKFGASVPEKNGVSDSDVTTVSDIEYELDFGHTVSGAIGIAFDGGYRAEFEVGNQINDIDTISGVEVASGTRYTPSISSADISVTTFLANAYKDFSLANKLSSYLSAGVGIAYSEATADNASATYGNTTLNWTEVRSFDDTVFAWQLGAGLNYDLTSEIIVDVGYRYLGTDDFTFEKNTIVEFGSHNVTAGIRYSF